MKNISNSPAIGKHYVTCIEVKEFLRKWLARNEQVFDSGKNLTIAAMRNPSQNISSSVQENDKFD